MIPNLKDGFNLLGKLTPRKSLNVIKVLVSYYYSKFTKSPYHSGKPISIAFEPTTACNLGCPECPSGLRDFSRPTGNLQMELFQKVINELSREIIYLTFYFQGEPYINPSFLDMVSYASKRGIYTATSTNAHFMDDEMAEKTVRSGLDRLIISIDGTTQEVYEQYRRRGSLEKVIEGTKNIIAAKKKLGSNTPNIVFQFLVVKPNQHQIEDVKKLGKELGVDSVKLKSAQVYDYENGNELIPDIDKYSRYKKTDSGKWKIKNPLDNHCWKLWNSCVITWDGSVLPCCFDKDGKHSSGNLQQNTFSELWNNEKYKNFRAAVLRSRNEIDICKNCSEGTQVWV